MNYEQKYKEALGRAKELHSRFEDMNAGNVLEDIFPELRESDDERIRNFLIKQANSVLESITDDDEEVPAWKSALSWLEKQGEKAEPIDGFNTEFERQISHLIASTINKEYDYTKDFVKWTSGALLNYAKHELEKQGRQKSQCKSAFELWKDMRFEVYLQASGNRHEPNYSDDSTKMFSINDIDEIFEKVAEKQGEQKPTDKGEPKFKVGDFVVNDYCLGKIIELTDDAYLLDTGQGIPFSCEHNAHLWTIQDAKDGDVLVHNCCTFIFMGIKDGIVQAIEENMLKQVPFGKPDKYNDYHPATKEQRDALLKAMAEAGYTFDFEKKELKKIEQKSYQETLDEAIELYYYSYGNGKGGFNKLSLENFKDIVKTFVEDYGNKPAEWSEEDEGMYLRTLGILGTCRLGILPTKVEEELEWLKSLKPQQNQYDKGYNDGYSAAKYNHWKPSEEQIGALNYAYCELFKRGENGEGSNCVHPLMTLIDDLKKL